jgi:hypothetical protein
MCQACVKSETPCIYPTRRKKPVYKSNIEKRKSTAQTSLQDIGKFFSCVLRLASANRGNFIFRSATERPGR